MDKEFGSAELASDWEMKFDNELWYPVAAVPESEVECEAEDVFFDDGDALSVVSAAEASSTDPS